ncbi:hypothetical protein NMG60_11000762 [Bertholletia excelsa]
MPPASPHSITSDSENSSDSHPSPSWLSSGPGWTVSSKACAACRYQRRRCPPDCVLAPYFPANRENDFLNVQRLFGVSNITKVIQTVKPLDRDIAAKCMISHATIRSMDPVGGCYGIICELQRQIERCKDELDLVLYQLSICKAESTQQNVIEESRSMFLNPDCFGVAGLAKDIKPFLDSRGEPRLFYICVFLYSYLFITF